MTVAVSDWSTNPSENTSCNGVNIAEFCPPGNLNDAARQIMSSIRAALPDTALDLLDEPSYAAMLAKLGAAASTDALTSLAPLVPAVDRLPYFAGTGPAAGALAAFTTFGRGVVASADATGARSVLAAAGIAAVSLANPGYIRFLMPGGSSIFQIAWGSFVANGDGPTAVNYAVPFPNQSFPVVSGANEANPGAQDNFPAVQTASNVGFQVWNASNAATTYYIACGF
jgi:hypothetical protein